MHFFDLFTSLFGEGTPLWALSERRDSGEEDRWTVFVRYREHLFASFYHAFNKPSALEQVSCLIHFERGQVELTGWIPDRLRLEGLVNGEEATRLTQLFPAATLHRWSHSRAGCARTAALFRSVIGIGAVSVRRGETSDLCASGTRCIVGFSPLVQDRAYQPRVTGADGRAARFGALRAMALAMHTVPLSVPLPSCRAAVADMNHSPLRDPMLPKNTRKKYFCFTEKRNGIGCIWRINKK